MFCMHFVLTILFRKAQARFLLHMCTYILVQAHVPLLYLCCICEDISPNLLLRRTQLQISPHEPAS